MGIAQLVTEQLNKILPLQQWLEPSKLLVSPLEVKPLESSWLPKLPASQPRPPEVSRSPTGTGLAQWLSGRSGGTKVHGVAHKEAAIPAVGQGNCPRFQDRSQISVFCCYGSTRGECGLLGGFVRGHQPLCHSREEGHHYAQGHPARKEDQGRAGLNKIESDFSDRHHSY